MTYKVRAINENEKLWTNLVSEVEELENRDEMTTTNAVSPEITWCIDCCFQI
ncbi:hypothetical protein [Paenibacillus sambharensis]|uniref:hypothetical protein n=1 Tax=Paenibacillus sambharensis TaxID=1803190 RepID=UPI0015E886AF|nr:hypothetical protein [Paenibacillus sambharensis]